MSAPPSYLDQVAHAIRAATPPGVLPADADLDALFRLYAVLALAKGEAVTAADVHHAWSAWMLNRGHDHASLVPFDALAPEIKAADEPFVEAIRHVAREID